MEGAIEGQKAMEIFSLVVKNRMLPEKMTDLVPLSFIGQAAVTFYRAKVKAMQDLGMSEEQRKVTLSDGQDAGEMLLEIEKKIGELLPSEKEAMAGTESKRGITKGMPRPKVLPEGINGKRSHQARAIARHPEIVEKVKKQARENEDIPTKTAVLSQIAYEKEKKRREEAEGKRKEIAAVVAIDQIEYLNALDKCIAALPQKPPKTWNESAFAQAKAKAKIIIRRLEVFQNGQ